MSANEKQDRHRLVKLSDASAFPRWKSSLQDHFFHKIHNTNMDKLTRTKTLDADFFKKEAGAELAAAYKVSSKDDDNKSVDPMTNMGFADKCFQHAIDTGEGFHPWLYTLYADVRSTLSDKIKDQTAGVSRGDLVGCLPQSIWRFDTTRSSTQTTWQSSTLTALWQARATTI